MKFRDLKIEQFFDFVNDENRMLNSFWDRCIKTGPRSYKSVETGVKYTVGSINAVVYHASSNREA